MTHSFDTIFDSIRPYNDEETAAAMQRIKGSPMLPMIESYVFPDKDKGYLANLLADIKGVDDFQQRVMKDVVERVVYKTTQGLTVGGLDNLVNKDGKPGKFLLLSTHRDIVLDPAFIQLVFNRSSFPTTEIAVGDNLFYNPEVKDMMSSNKMVVVKRSGSSREIYESSSLLSEYIRLQVSSQNSSVWIAHRQGRTKDGHDITEKGLLKMLDMSGSGTFEENFLEISIVPVAISYEYETCGALKALELYTREMNGGVYEKKPGEDLNSMVQGFKQPKGRVHIQFCKPLSQSEIYGGESLSKNEKFNRLAALIDSKLLEAYKLWPSNYIAADLVKNGTEYSNMYTAEDKEKFLNHIESETSGMPEAVKLRLLYLYAAHIG